MKQYLDLCQRIVDEGIWVENERTGKRCLTVINADLEYDVGAGQFPLVTTRKSYYKAAIAEMLGFLRGHSNAEQFRKLGTKTWDANANENESWLNNINRMGDDDCGLIYGAAAKHWPNFEGHDIDTMTPVLQDICNGVDNRGEIIMFWNPGLFDHGCLRPCMYSHHFSILGDTLYLNSTQRSCDVPLGLTFNMVQVYFLLAVMAQIAGLKPGKAYHKIVNAHIYEDQLDLMQNVQLKREPLDLPTFEINPDIKTLEDLMTWVTVDDFKVVGYEHHDPIAYPFSV